MSECPCKRTKCERHGDCEACRAHHAAFKRLLPACERAEARKRKIRTKAAIQKDEKQ